LNQRKDSRNNIIAAKYFEYVIGFEIDQIKTGSYTIFTLVYNVFTTLYTGQLIHRIILPWIAKLQNTYQMTHLVQVLLFFTLLPLFALPQQKETWITKPSDQWPSIALINKVQFKNGDRYVHPSFSYAGTGFLIDYKNDTFAATAKHILWVAKNKQSKAVQINEALEQWTMSPKGNQADSVVPGKLLNEDSLEVLEGPSSTILERDWIVFSVKRTSPRIYPLKPRFSEVQPGEKVYFLSCGYSDSTCRVYTGKILRKLGMDILIERNMKENTGGSSGSAVIDANGYLIGILSSASNDSQTGKDVAVAVSTEYLLDALNKKAGLNTPKEDYGKLIFATALKQGAQKAIRQYIDLTNNPKNYYTYNLRSANRNGLSEAAQKLIDTNRINDAIEILEFNARINSSYFVNYNLLAKAYLLAGNKKEAIKNYRLSTQKLDSREENEAFKELEKLQNN
jgi:tetratricopeptide (TPR) repeat protein